ncbi:MAG TPA: ferrous iron transport protein B [Gemmataceae bacterium]|nr:ferrous iron transport protein B [Gemmataceae bacterium]
MPGAAALPSPSLPVSPAAKVIALVGNPNTGKSTLFNALAGMRQRVGNYPGVTVEIKKGRMSLGEAIVELVDLPGTYSLAPRSPDEMVAVNLVLGQQAGERRPDAVLALVDASNLERNLYLVTQIMELGIPVIVALNMVDVAERQGIRVDADRLAAQLGVPVIPIQANRSKGIDRLKEVLRGDLRLPMRSVVFPEAFDHEVGLLQKLLGSAEPVYLVRRALLDTGGAVEDRLVHTKGADLRIKLVEARQRLAASACATPGVEARVRYRWIRETAAGCVTRPAQRLTTWTDRLDRVITHRLWGTLIFFAIMFLVFQSIFTWAKPLMDLIVAGKSRLGDFLGGTLPPGPLTSLLIEGVLEGVGSVIVFLPQIAILFAFIAILEDCGYMARAAFLMDRLMARCGLSGKSFIPLLSSVACAVPGIMATRVIENRRDRLTTIMVAPLMSCSARLPVYVLLIGAFLTEGFPWWTPGLTMFCMYAIGFVLAPAIALLLKSTLLRGSPPPFILEMPSYKRPSFRIVFQRVVDSSGAFLRRAGTLILAAMILVWALLYFPSTAPDGSSFEKAAAANEARVAELKTEIEAAPENAEKLRAKLTSQEESGKKLLGDWKRQSYLGRMGRFIEPAVRPLGWDWRVGMAALASFPAREVVVGTLGITYNQGRVDSDEIREAANVGETGLARALKEARWEEDPERKIFTIPTVLSLLVFFALCCQCVSTLAVIRRETNSWRWPVFTFVYMTVLAYVAALAVYQIGSRIG